MTAKENKKIRNHRYSLSYKLLCNKNLKNWFMFIELWMYAGGLESTKKGQELLQTIAKSNSSFFYF